MQNIGNKFCLGEIPFAGKYLQDSHLLWIQTFRGWKHSGFCRWNIIFRFYKHFKSEFLRLQYFILQKFASVSASLILATMSRILKITRYLIPQLCSLFFVYFTACEYFLRQKCVSEYLAFDAFDLQANNEIFWPAATGTRVLRNLIPSRAQLPLSVSTAQNALILPISLWW